MTERMASVGGDRLRLIQGAKGFGKTVKMQKQRYNFKDITKESEEMQIEALERLTELKEMYGEENIISRRIHVDETTPPSA